MKKTFTGLLLICSFLSMAQTPQDTTLHPIEQTTPTNYGWWMIGVIMLLAIGVALYMLLKKNPRKDAV